MEEEKLEYYKKEDVGSEGGDCLSTVVTAEQSEAVRRWELPTRGIERVGKKPSFNNIFLSEVPYSYCFTSLPPPP